jgi:hypothetical protein
MWCDICDYPAHDGCCEGCIGHTRDDQCVTEDLVALQNNEQEVYFPV